MTIKVEMSVDEVSLFATYVDPFVWQTVLYNMGVLEIPDEHSVVINQALKNMRGKGVQENHAELVEKEFRRRSEQIIDPYSLAVLMATGTQKSLKENENMQKLIALRSAADEILVKKLDKYTDDALWV